MLPADLLALRLTSICGRPITKDAIRQWAARKKIHALGWDGRRRTYSANETLRYARLIDPDLTGR